jgi:hypothetical protein
MRKTAFLVLTAVLVAGAMAVGVQPASAAPNGFVINSGGLASLDLATGVVTPSGPRSARWARVQHQHRYRS